MNTKQILVIAAHPDDELLGVGGTIALHTLKGDNVTCVVFAAGNLFHDKDGQKGVYSQAQNSADVLGVKDFRLLKFPDQRLDQYSLVDLITPLEQIVQHLQPNIVYLQYGYDINKDHQILFQAALVALRPIEKSVEAVYAFDTVSSTEWAYPRSFIPDTWVDISTTLDKKINAMACYETELRNFPHPRSLHSLRVKAESCGSQVLVDAAECFMTIRRIYRDDKTPV